MKKFELTNPQKSIWVTEEFYKGTSIENIGGSTIIHDKVDFEKLKKAINLLVKNNDSLRLRFVNESNLIKQYISDYEELKLDIKNVESEKDVKRIEKEFVNTPFDVFNSLLFRFQLYKFKDGHGGFIVIVHHLIADAWGSGIIISQIMDAYNSLLETGDYASNTTSYLDYISSEEEYLTSSKFEKDEAFWIEEYSSVPELATIPGSIQGKEISSKAKRKVFKIPAQTMDFIDSYCRDNKISPFNFFMGAYSLYLSRVSGLDEFVIGTPVLNRSNAKEKHAIGMFISVVPFKVNINHEESFSEFASKISSNFFSIFRHQKYPYQMLLENLRKQNSSTPNLYSAILSYQNMRTNTKNSKTPYETEWLFNGNVGDDMEIHFFDINDSGVINVAYDFKTSKYTTEDVYSIHSRLLHIMNQILENNNILLKDIEIVTHDEKDEILYRFNDTKMDYPKDKTIVELFEEQLEKTPDNIAVVFEDQKLTYKELNEKANSLAHYLMDNGLKSNQIVSLFLDKSLESIVAILATLKCGSAYMPIDINYPSSRIKFMIDNSNSTMILTCDSLKGKLKDFSNVYCIDLSNDEVYSNNLKSISLSSSSEDLAYIMYTSGSTGEPKGVMVSNKNIVRLVKNTNYIKFEKRERILQTGSIVFDACTFEIWGALLNGFELYIIKKQNLLDPICLEKYLVENKITILWLTAPLFNQLSESNPKMFSTVRVLLTGGDVLSPKHINSVRIACPNLTIINGYGPTENTTFSTCFTVDKNYETSIPIGYPIANSTCYIVSKDLNLMPVGVSGELLVGGDGVSKGYLNNFDFTKSKFIPNKFGEGLLYKTGDLVKWRADGSIDFVGRVDNQVKIRGFRVELGEITLKIQEFQGIKECITVVKTINNEKMICSYFSSDENIDISLLKEFLKNSLPHYAIPTYFIKLDALPINANGKVDINKLPEPENINVKAEIVLPRNEIDSKLINILKSLLNVNSISIDDSFFELGGDSLSAINLCAQIQNEFNCQIFVKDILEHSQVQEISDIITKNGVNIEQKLISHAPKADYYPVSSAQKRMYFASAVGGQDSILYNIPGGVILEGELDAKKLEGCFRTLILRHESLRTYFELLDGQVVQKILGNFDFKLDVLENQNYEELDVFFEDFVKPFDLSKAPLFRTKLVKFTNGTCVLFVDMHHIVSDGTSVSILIDELCKLYNGETLADLNITYKDFSAFENKRLTSGELKEAEDYWLGKFQDEIPQLNLPTKNTRPAVQSFEGKKIYSNINKDMVNKIDALSKNLGVTPYMMMLGAYYILLSRYTSQDDIVIGTPAIGRDIADTYSLIGMFVNTLALREKIDSKLTFKEFLKKLKENLLNCYKYQTYPFDELVNKLEIKRDTSRNPLFDTMFTYQNNGFKNIHFENIKSKYYIPDTNISKFDLSVEVIPNENGAELSFEYATKLFDEEFIKAMSKHYLNILNNLLENTDTKISEIEMLSEEEKNKILYEFNNTKMDYPKDKTIVQLFEEQVEKTPGNIAVVFEDKKLTYKELNEKANSLANYLITQHLQGNDVVAIMLNRSFETIISILAVLKLGGIYTLIDNTLPEARINYILQNCKAKMLINDSNFENSDINVFNIKSVKLTINHENLNTSYSSKDDFAIIYTSGSTGNPKGVLLHNEGLVNLVYAFKDILDLSSSKNQLGFTTVSFDMFAVELFSSILLGRTLYLLNEEEIKNPILISNIIIKNNIDFLICTPSKLELLLTNNDISKCLKQLKGFQLGGEVFTPELYKKISNITDAQIYNGYGPTEITACCSNKHVKSETDINIGTPIPNMKIYILDKDSNLCPTNVPGELCVSGFGVSHGYIFDDKKTSKVFVKSKFNDELLYKTGDIGYYNSNGELQYIGRNDFQVKINGLRIELSEIEKQFCNITDVESCVIVADKTKSYLKAFFVAKSHLSIPAMRIKLAEKLPAYMIPRYIEQLDSIPITNSGKIDRLALDILVPKIENNSVTYVEPETDLQRKFCAIWENILGTKVGIDNDLFELGADSLTAIRFKVEALDQGIDIPYADIFKYKTIRNLCTSKTQEIATTPIENFDYTNIDKLLNKNKSQLNYKLNINKNNHVLLLGSNGFVGMHIIDSFIKNDTGIIYCLMRDKNGKGALNRFLEVLHFYFGNTLDSYIGNRIIVLKGDILKENFGLSQRNYNKIIDDVSTVINTAANVKHFGDFDKFKNINIDSIKRTIDFCKLYSKKLIHISTLSISGNMFLDNTISKEKLTKEKKKYFSEKNLFINQSLDNVYTRSKFEAEKIVLDNIASGKMNGLILRLGNITSRYSDGRFQINPENNAFTSRLKSFVALGFIPKSLVNKEIEFTPVDLCADSIIKCLQYSNNTTSVLHIYNRHHIKINLILNVLKEFNLPIKIINDNNFADYINNILSNESKKLYINGIANDLTIDRKLTYDSNIYIKSDFSVNYLLRCNFKWSKINREYIIKYITYLKSINFFTKD